MQALITIQNDLKTTTTTIKTTAIKVQQVEKRADKAGWEVQQNRSRAPSTTAMVTALLIEA